MRDLFGPHGFLLIGAVNTVELEPVAVNDRGARMGDRPADDTGAFHGSAFDDAFVPERIEQRQQRKAENGKIVAVDFLEQLDADALDLVGTDRAERRLARRGKIAPDE